jgi:hypothetical protein
MYRFTFVVLYSIVIVPFARAFGFDIPVVDVGPALRMLVGLLGLDLGS